MIQIVARREMPSKKSPPHVLAACHSKRDEGPSIMLQPSPEMKIACRAPALGRLAMA